MQEKAICSFKIELEQKKVQLLPAGNFRAKDGRPYVVDSWKLDYLTALKIIDKVRSFKDDLVIDYEHQTLETSKNGQPAPAAGWFKNLEWIDGKGLFATDVIWTSKAKQLIKNNEYRYISPVISYDKLTGHITSIQMAALTNYAAIDGMNNTALLSANPALENQIHQLSEIELNMCEQMGLKLEDYIAANTVPVPLKYQFPTLSEFELDMCEKMGIKPEDYIATNLEN
ncbi:MAG: phage protease [Pseudomonadota bacterium]